MLSVIGQVNARLLQKLKTDDDAPYHNKTLNFSSSSSNTPSKFPTLSVVSLGELDSDDTLGHEIQEAIWSTIELKAYSKESLTDATKLLGYAGDVMFSMFYARITENVLSDTEPFCRVARYRRLIGNDDILYKPY